MRLLCILFGVLCLIATASAACKEDCITGLSVVSGVADTCGAIGGLMCAIFAAETFGASCITGLACDIGSAVLGPAKEACRLCSESEDGNRWRSLDNLTRTLHAEEMLKLDEQTQNLKVLKLHNIRLGVKVDEISSKIDHLEEQMKELSDVELARINDVYLETVELKRGQIDIEILILYGHYFNMYSDTRKLFNQLTKTATGAIRNDQESKKFYDAATDPHFGLDSNAEAFSNMILGGHPLMKESIFVMSPKTCKDGTYEKIRNAMLDCFLLESIARSMKDDYIKPIQTASFKKNLVRIEERHVLECGCPLGQVKAIRTNLQKLKTLPPAKQPAAESLLFAANSFQRLVDVEKTSFIYAAKPFDTSSIETQQFLKEMDISTAKLFYDLSRYNAINDLYDLYEDRAYCSDPGNGVVQCEGHGFTAAQCGAVGCCHFDDGQCWSSVGSGQCRPSSRDCVWETCREEGDCVGECGEGIRNVTLVTVVTKEREGDGKPCDETHVIQETCDTGVSCPGPCFDEGIVYPGLDIKHDNRESASECQKFCRNTTGCHFFSWNRNKNCWLKNGMKSKSPDSAVTSGPAYCGYCFDEGTDYTGLDIRKDKRDFASECQDLCRKTSGCNFFSWKRNKDCSLMKGLTGKSQNNAVTSGPAYCGPKTPTDPFPAMTLLVEGSSGEDDTGPEDTSQNTISRSGKDLVLQRRVRGGPEAYFQKTYQDYQHGFNNGGEVWLGLDTLHQLTSSSSYSLHVKLTDFDSLNYTAVYDNFKVAGAVDGYRLTVSGFRQAESTLGDSMTSHSNKTFSTMDRAQDGWISGSSIGSCSGSCKYGKGGWWFRDDGLLNPNGRNAPTQMSEGDIYMFWVPGGKRGNSKASFAATEFIIRQNY